MKALKRHLTLVLIAGASAVTIAACGATVQGARAIHSQTTGDSPTTWIYFETSDADLNGVYRCYDHAGNPVCKKAQLKR